MTDTGATGAGTAAAGRTGPGPTALVLAGGGTKGAFEVGALRYLIEEAGVIPDIITATSAGTILAGVLAQARTSEEFVARTDELRRDLLAMTDVGLLFAKQPWLTDFDGTPFGAMVDSFISDRTRPAPPEGVIDHLGPGADAGKRRPHHRLHALTQVLEALPAAGHAKKDLPGHQGSLLTLDPLEGALKGTTPSPIQPIDPGLVARPGLQLRLGITALGAGTIRYVCEDGTITGRDATTPVDGAGAGPIDVRDGILASSTVPMIFEPRPLAEEVYVDGGVLQNIPVEAAARLGAERIIAVLAVPIEQPPDPRDFTKVNFAGVFMRATGAIKFGETQVSNLAYPLAEGQSLTIIDPTIDVVGPFEVQPGLMLIDMSYGWLRAADVITGAEDDRRRHANSTSDAITVARERAWYFEEALWCADLPVDESAIEVLRAIKLVVRSALDDRRTAGLPVPAEADAWWSRYETHNGAQPPDLPPAGLVSA